MGGQTNAHNEEQSGMILFKTLTKKFVKDGALQFQKFCVNFAQFYALVSMRLFRLGCLKFCAQSVLRMFTGVHKMQRMVLALPFVMLQGWQ
jgi:hypothetical protein